MQRDTDMLIAGLVEELKPVRRLRFGDGLALALGGLVLSLALMGGLFGLRPDLAAGVLDPMLVIAGGLFFLLGLAAAVTVVVMGQPRVGSGHDGWKWAAAMAALLPLAGIIAGTSRGDLGLAGSNAEIGLACLRSGLGFAVLTFALLVLWLRRGAPTSPTRAGLLTGIAAGSFGVLAVSIHCPSSDIAHIGLWHGAGVIVSALLGRVAVPRLIRW